MNAADLWGLLGVFLGGAIPWLEAVVVIPAGIIAGLPVAPVILAGAAGNLLTVAVAAFAWEWVRQKWSAWRRRRRQATGKADDPEAEARRAATAQKRRSRVERIMNRGGLPLLALVGPLGVGTQLSAIVAVAAGARAWPAFLWIGGATLGWCIVAGVAAVQGIELLGLIG
ncbi:MAG TPA: small multi-drug export protein [Candidatus Brachybacterium merdavium]|uniref:Small multi-drug export protein n=1 Tax=Candidatus Brachybacterium merdavium TaxID=2838513 RepID=A0A9D2LFU9_9MICO|nr:small multi-drug export protein [Candidatus Brachybacterium merdavium]